MPRSVEAPPTSDHGNGRARSTDASRSSTPCSPPASAASSHEDHRRAPGPPLPRAQGRQRAGVARHRSGSRPGAPPPGDPAGLPFGRPSLAGPLLGVPGGPGGLSPVARLPVAVTKSAGRGCSDVEAGVPNARQVQPEVARVEGCRVEAGADEVEPSVGRTGTTAERLQEVLVTPRPTAVLRRARPAATDAAGNGRARLHRADLLDGDLVAPVVAEVVGVVERVALTGDGVEASGAFIVRRRPEVPVRIRGLRSGRGRSRTRGGGSSTTRTRPG